MRSIRSIIRRDTTGSLVELVELETGRLRAALFFCYEVASVEWLVARKTGLATEARRAQRKEKAKK
jgi:hypothetical protein